jgi:hypothetical protein
MTQDEAENGRGARTHPHAEATYRVIPFDDGSFGVEVKIPGSYPTTVSKFASEADAAAWTAEHCCRSSASKARLGFPPTI